VEQMTKTELDKKLIAIYPNLFKYSMSLTRNKQDAHDVLMEAIVSFLKTYKQSQVMPDNLQAYLITAIKNKFINETRRTQKIEVMDDLDEFLEPSNEDTRSDPLLRRRIAEAFSQLGDACREIIALRSIGHSYSEMSGIVNKPRNTIAGSLFNCRGYFRELLGGDIS
jgi:RNA polymerase sigma factor (sigma-70 family)